MPWGIVQINMGSKADQSTPCSHAIFRAARYHPFPRQVQSTTYTATRLAWRYTDHRI